VDQSVLLRLGRCVQTIVGQLTSVPFLRFIPQEVSVLCRICNCVLLKNPKVTRCQKCQKPSEYPFGTFGTPSVSVFEKRHALLGPTLRPWTDLHPSPSCMLRASGCQ
jgi:hypothetical protein